MLKKLTNVFFLGVAAGTMIGIGGAVYLACTANTAYGIVSPSVDKYVGALLFAVALLTICYTGMYLYTGKICYLFGNHSLTGVLSLVAGIAGNFIGAVFTGILTSIASQPVYDRAQSLAASKLGMKWYNVIIMGFFCGILIYAAVEIFRAKKSPVGIIFAIPVFIICCFEHSIADMYYMAAARSLSWQTVVFILLVILGNTVGGLFVPALMLLGGKTGD